MEEALDLSFDRLLMMMMMTYEGLITQVKIRYTLNLSHIYSERKANWIGYIA